MDYGISSKAHAALIPVNAPRRPGCDAEPGLSGRMDAPLQARPCCRAAGTRSSEGQMKAPDVMTRNVISVRTDTSVTEAIRLMLDERISGLPVVDPTGRLAGIVTKGDFLRRSGLGTEQRRPGWLQFLLGAGREAGEFVRTHGRKVEEVMSRDVQSATEDTSLEEIVRLMECHGIRRVPILRGSRLVGIVSRADLLKALEPLLAQGAASAAGSSAGLDDAAIEQRVLEAIARQGWAAQVTLTVSADHGTATLRGIISDERQRRALRVLAENIPGVKAVREELLWVEPASGMAIVVPEDKADAPEERSGRS